MVSIGMHKDCILPVKVYQPEDALEQVDIILNTTNIENWKILENMKEQSIPMLRFDEILGDME